MSEQIIRKTKSLCDVCLEKVPAYTFIKNGKVFIKKKCPKHGEFTGDHVWDDPELYRGLVSIKTIVGDPAQISLVLTNKCNLNCPVCYAKANELGIDELKVEDLDKTNDYSVVMLTGGEPTIRKDLMEIIRKLKRKGKRVVMFSNGLKLTNEKYVRALKRAGLGYVILQFDALDDDDYEYIRGKRMSEIKRKAFSILQKLRLPVYPCCVMVKGKSFNRMKEIFDFTEKFPVVKNVTINSLWRLGRYREDDFVPNSEIVKKASEIYGLKKEDWLDSTRFFCNVDKILSMFGPRRRLFGKCNLKCLFVLDKGKAIPFGKIFAVKKINRKITNIYDKKSHVSLWLFFLYFFLDQVILNLFLNKNFRILVKKMVLNSGHLLRKEFFLFNPFQYLTVSIFPTLRNIDLDFVEGCNAHEISSDDLNLDSGCIHRIKAIKKQEEGVESSKL